MLDTSPQVVDLVHSRRSFTDALPDLRLFRERFFRSCRTRLFQTMRINAQVGEDESSVMLHDDYLRVTNESPCLYTIYEIPPLRGLAIIAISRSLLAAIVDARFGAGRLAATVEEGGQDFSIMERRTGDAFSRMAAQSLKDAFLPQIEFTPAATGTEVHADVVSVADSAEPFCVMAAQLSLATGEGNVSAAIPFRALEPYRAALSSVVLVAAKHDGEKVWEEQMDAALGAVPIELAAEAGVVSVPLSRLSCMRIGDVMPLKLFQSARVVPSDGEALFLADYGGKDGEIHLRVQTEEGT